MSNQAKSAGELVRSTNEGESSSFEPKALRQRDFAQENKNYTRIGHLSCF